MSCPHETEWRSVLSRNGSDESTKDELCFTSVNGLNVEADLLMIPALFQVTASSEPLAVLMWSEDTCDES